MNDPLSTRNGSPMLKDNYEDAKTGRDALTSALRIRRKKLAQTKIGSRIADSPMVLNNIAGINKPGRGL